MSNVTYGQHGGSNQGAKVAPPHGLEREVIAHLLETEQHASNGTAKGNTNACSRTRAQNLPRLGGIAPVLVEEAADDVARTHGIVHAGPFLANAEAARNRQRQADALDEERGGAEEALHDESGDDALHLADARAGGVRGKALDQRGGGEGEQGGEEHVQDVVDGRQGAPALPLGAAGVGAPAAEALVEVEGGGAVAELDVRQPLGDDVEHGGVEANGGADQRHHDPRLAGIVGLGDLAAPLAPASAQEDAARVGRGLGQAGFAAGPAPQRLARGVLHPVDGGEVLVALDLGDLARNRRVCLR